MKQGTLMSIADFKKATSTKKSEGGFKKKNKKKEENVQMKVCEYLKDEYPDVIFTCDLSSGMKLPIHIAAKNKEMRSSRALPDLTIYELSKEYSSPTKGPNPVRYIKTYSGLVIEIKSEDTIIYKKDGTIRKNEHLEEQNEILRRLTEKGYKAVFGIGFEACKKIIDDYLKK